MAAPRAGTAEPAWSALLLLPRPAEDALSASWPCRTEVRRSYRNSQAVEGFGTGRTGANPAFATGRRSRPAIDLLYCGTNFARWEKLTGKKVKRLREKSADLLPVCHRDPSATGWTRNCGEPVLSMRRSPRIERFPVTFAIKRSFLYIRRRNRIVMPEKRPDRAEALEEDCRWAACQISQHDGRPGWWWNTIAPPLPFAPLAMGGLDAHRAASRDVGGVPAAPCVQETGHYGKIPRSL